MYICMINTVLVFPPRGSRFVEQADMGPSSCRMRLIFDPLRPTQRLVGLPRLGHLCNHTGRTIFSWLRLTSNGRRRVTGHKSASPTAEVQQQGRRVKRAKRSSEACINRRQHIFGGEAEHMITKFQPLKSIKASNSASHA